MMLSRTISLFQLLLVACSKKVKIPNDFSNSNSNINFPAETVGQVSTMSAALQLGAAWPMSGRNQYHTGQSPFINRPPLYPLIAWVFSTPTVSGFVSAPSISSDGTLFVGSNDGYLYALYADGNLKWKFKTGDPN